MAAVLDRAKALANVSKTKMGCAVISFLIYLQEVPYFCDEVLPRLVRLGVQVKH